MKEDRRSKWIKNGFYSFLFRHLHCFISAVYLHILPLIPPPNSPVKLVFIHHSCGENWLADDDGGLGIALRDNNYFVSDVDYGWGPDGMRDRTDIGHWWEWFPGPESATYTYMEALYNESERSWGFYPRLAADPGGENEIIMFKSCFPNSFGQWMSMLRRFPVMATT